MSSDVAMIQVLGAIAYGEQKAYEGAKARAAEATDAEERRAWRKIAAQELRHHKGFVARLEAMGADPERAMRPYRGALDTYHGGESADPVEEAVWSYLGEGIADDLLVWLRRVSDAETAAFIDTVIADEEEHEEKAASDLASVLAGPRGRVRAGRAVATMLLRMAASGQRAPTPLLAFLRLGRGPELVGGIVSGYARRVGHCVPLPR